MKLPFVITGLILAAAGAAAADFVRDDLSTEDAKRVAAVTALPADFSKPEQFEAMPAGAATVRKARDQNGFSHPSGNLTFEDQEKFLLGNGLFRKDWVSAPSSTQASDGLGPLFNARACQSCHIKDGRGQAPAHPEDDPVSLLVRISVPPDAAQEAAIAESRLVAAPDPVYGTQLQDFAVAGLPAEGKVRIDYEEVPVSFADGTGISLRKPKLSIEKPGFGPFAGGLMMSARVAPPMLGMGLLEAIHPADIMAHADPDDADGDGISGRPNMARDGDGNLVVGRFGWKAVEPDILHQTAHAFSGDMGLSTPVSPNHWGECTKRQPDCRAMPNGAQPQFGPEEVPQDLLDLVVFYSKNLGVPARKDVSDPQVLRGKEMFHAAGCAACHVPKYVTSRNADHPAQRFQLIWPYTDLLLHDMGDGLADNRTEGLANGREWRTPPLWGIGATHAVSTEAGFLHDGRARTLLEAVMWHGGEAQDARDRVAGLDTADREALIRFLESL